MKIIAILCMTAALSSAQCDRASLNKTVATYLAALVAHDTKFVEQAVPTKIGEGLWKTADMNFNRFDLPAAHIFKIQGGEIHEIETTGFSLPYNSKTGWE